MRLHLKQAVDRLLKIDTCYWWHESALSRELGLQETENKTVRQLLSEVLKLASSQNSDWSFEELKDGTSEAFSEHGVEKRTRPRYYLLDSKNRNLIALKEQKRALKETQGTHGCRIRLDESSKERRQNGWKPWAEQDFTDPVALEFETYELPLLVKGRFKYLGRKRELSRMKFAGC